MQLLRDNLTVSVCSHMALKRSSLCNISVVLALMSVLWPQYASNKLLCWKGQKVCWLSKWWDVINHINWYNSTHSCHSKTLIRVHTEMKKSELVMYFEIPKRFLKTFYSGLTQRTCVKVLEVVNSVSCVIVAAQTRSLRRQLCANQLSFRGTWFLEILESLWIWGRKNQGIERFWKWEHGILKVLEFICFVKEQIILILFYLTLANRLHSAVCMCPSHNVLHATYPPEVQRSHVCMSSWSLLLVSSTTFGGDELNWSVLLSGNEA